MSAVSGPSAATARGTSVSTSVSFFEIGGERDRAALSRRIDLGDKGVRFLARLAIVDGNLPALAREIERDRAADALARAGDKGMGRDHGVTFVCARNQSR